MTFNYCKLVCFRRLLITDYDSVVVYIAIVQASLAKPMVLNHGTDYH